MYTAMFCMLALWIPIHGIPLQVKAEQYSTNKKSKRTTRFCRERFTASVGGCDAWMCDAWMMRVCYCVF